MKIYSLLAILSFVLGLVFLLLPVFEVYVIPTKSLPCYSAKIGGIVAIVLGFISFFYIKQTGEKELLLAVFGILLGILATFLVCL